MTENILDTIKKIISIPQDFNMITNLSWNALLLQSGYFENYDKIGELEIENILRQNPDLIQDWLQWSEDSRSSERWGFIKGESGRYYVGHWPPEPKYQEFQTDDAFKACSHFIWKQIEESRIYLTSKSSSKK